MMLFVARRVGIVIISLIGASIAVFAVLNVLPGSPAQVILGTQATPASVRQLTAQLGLNKPLWRQYIDWIGGLVHGSFGNSYISHQPIGHQIGQALTVTGPLIVLALVVGLVVAVPLGLAGALYNGRLSGSFLGVVSQIGLAIPTVVGGLLLITAFAVKTSLFPTGSFPGWSDPLQALRALVLPAVALGVVEGAILSRYVRASVLDQLRSDYLRTARAKGLRVGKALRQHGMRNAMVPLVTVVGLELASLIVGAIVVENVFELPGLGEVLLSSVNNRDLLTVQDISMIVAAAVLIINLLVDLSYRLLESSSAGVGVMSNLPAAIGEVLNIEPITDPETTRTASRRRWTRNPSTIIGGGIVAVIVIVAVVSLFWTPYNPLAVDPAHHLAGPSLSHLLGTDEYGRDVFSRLMAGTRVTLYVGALSVLLATVIGVPAGLLAAQAGGAPGQIVLRLADIIYGFPALLAAIVLAAALGASKNTVTLAVGIAYIPVFIRVTRSNALVVLSSEYVLAARAYNRRPIAILRRHVIPNIATTIIAQMSLLFSLAVLAEAALDYLNLGTTAPAASWGLMLADGQNYLGNDALLVVWPSIVIVICVLGFSLLGEGIGELRDARSRR